jgi:hypothetical protein
MYKYIALLVPLNLSGGGGCKAPAFRAPHVLSTLYASPHVVSNATRTEHIGACQISHGPHGRTYWIRAHPEGMHDHPRLLEIALTIEAENPQSMKSDMSGLSTYGK